MNHTNTLESYRLEYEIVEDDCEIAARAARRSWLAAGRCGNRLLSRLRSAAVVLVGLVVTVLRLVREEVL